MEEFFIPLGREDQMLHGIAFTSILDLSRIHEFFMYVESLGFCVNFDGEYLDLHSESCCCPIGCIIASRPRRKNCRRFSSGLFDHMIRTDRAVRERFGVDYDGFLDRILTLRFARDMRSYYYYYSIKDLIDAVDQKIRDEISSQLPYDIYSIVMQYIHLKSDFFEHRLESVKIFAAEAEIQYAMLLKEFSSMYYGDE